MPDAQQVMGEDGQPTDAPEQQDEPQTVEIPLSAVKMPPKPGDMLQLKVVSVDEQGGVINAVAVEPEQEEGGSDKMADSMNLDQSNENQKV